VTSDGDLLERWRGGDAAAGGQLFDRHYAGVARFFANKAAAADAPDLVQGTFMALVESRDRFRGDSAFRTYLFATARNLLFKYYRTRQRAPELDFGVTSLHDLAPSPSSLLARRREEHLLLDALRRIPLEYQVVLELYYWEAMTAGEIAAVLDVPEGTARTRLRRAKELVQERIEAAAESPELAQRTVHDLDQWAAALRPQPIKAG
jgi:RNA polymerase sigma factor (sigma-70 family)